MIVQGRNIISHITGNPTGTRVIIHGDSITAGSSASVSGNAYTNLYKNITGLDVWPMGVSSRTVQESVQNWNVTNSLVNVVFSPTNDQAQYQPVFSYDSDFKYIIFRLGINDCLQKPSSSTSTITFKSEYIRCLNRFLELGWPVNRIKLINIGSYLGSNSEIIQAVSNYNTAITEICNQLNFQLIDLAGYDSTQNINTMYADDVHPNDLGHSNHATYIASIIS